MLSLQGLDRPCHIAPSTSALEAQRDPSPESEDEDMSLVGKLFRSGSVDGISQSLEHQKLWGPQVSYLGKLLHRQCLLFL